MSSQTKPRTVGMSPALGTPYGQQAEHSGQLGLVKCHFTVEELEYFRTLIERNEQVEACLAQLPLKAFMDVKVLPRPNVYGKLTSYLRKWKRK